MVYRFLLLSDEVDNFKREIQISSQATFLDFHKEILKSTGYDMSAVILIKTLRKCFLIWDGNRNIFWLMRHYILPALI